jgi:hypothetical protein
MKPVPLLSIESGGRGTEIRSRHASLGCAGRRSCRSSTIDHSGSADGEEVRRFRVASELCAEAPVGSHRYWPGDARTHQPRRDSAGGEGVGRRCYRGGWKTSVGRRTGEPFAGPNGRAEASEGLAESPLLMGNDGSVRMRRVVGASGIGAAGGACEQFGPWHFTGAGPWSVDGFWCAGFV